MLRFRTLCILPLSLLAACAADPASTGSDDADYTGVSFEEALTCEDGAAALDLAKTTHKALDVYEGKEVELRDAQMVVRNQGVVDFLSSKVNHLQNAKGEIIVRGSIPGDGEFDFFEDWNLAAPTTRQEGNKVRVREQMVAVVHRVKESEGRVRIAFNKTTQTMTCSTYWEEDHCAYDSYAQKRGELDVQRHDDPIADWVFSCAAP